MSSLVGHWSLFGNTQTQTTRTGWAFWDVFNHAGTSISWVTGI